jgi:hypothetical protein
MLELERRGLLFVSSLKSFPSKRLLFSNREIGREILRVIRCCRFTFLDLNSRVHRELSCTSVLFYDFFIDEIVIRETSRHLDDARETKQSPATMISRGTTEYVPETVQRFRNESYFTHAIKTVYMTKNAQVGNQVPNQELQTIRSNPPVEDMARLEREARHAVQGTLHSEVERSRESTVGQSSGRARTQG